MITIDLANMSDSFGIEISGVLGCAMLWMLDRRIDYRDRLVGFAAESRFVR